VPHPTTLVKLTRRLGEQTVTDLNEGVERVAIPRKGQPGAARQATEHTRGFRRLVKWRTGCEGRISHLKHRFGWDRTLMDGIGGARIWCGQGVFAHNLVKISGLLEANQAG
jgi:IS5 family transposase